MKKFIFRLENLLQHRKNLEEKERGELFRLLGLVQHEHDRRQANQAKYDETLAELTGKRGQGAQHQELCWFYKYLDYLRFEIEESEKRIVRLNKDILAQQNVVIEASKKKKILDTLKTKKEKEFIVTAERQDQKAIDEMVVLRFPQKEL